MLKILPITLINILAVLFILRQMNRRAPPGAKRSVAQDLASAVVISIAASGLFLLVWF